MHPDSARGSVLALLASGPSARASPAIPSAYCVVGLRAQPICVYCSVGVRSAAAAQELQTLGFTTVRNVQGSPFKWANEGRTLEGGNRVHAYDAQWGQLLRKDLRAPSPP